MSRSISRVLSRATIHLGRSSPIASSGLPGSGADHAFEPLFGLAPGGVYLAGTVARSRGALLPHPFTLTNRYPTAKRRDAAAVCFLLHFPWVRTPQGLPGALSCGARTFLTPSARGCLTDSLRSLAARATYGDSRKSRRYGSGLGRATYPKGQPLRLRSPITRWYRDRRGAPVIFAASLAAWPGGSSAASMSTTA